MTNLKRIVLKKWDPQDLLLNFPAQHPWFLYTYLINSFLQIFLYEFKSKWICFKQYIPCSPFPRWLSPISVIPLQLFIMSTDTFLLENFITCQISRRDSSQKSIFEDFLSNNPIQCPTLLHSQKNPKRCYLKKNSSEELGSKNSTLHLKLLDNYSKISKKIEWKETS